MLSLVTALFLLDGPIVSSPDFFSSCVVMKIPVSPVSNISIAARYCSRKPIMCVVSCLLNVYILAMGSFYFTVRSLERLIVGVSFTGVVVSCIQ